MAYDWDFSFLRNAAYLQLLASGLVTTLLLSVISCFLGTLLGFAVGGAASLSVLEGHTGRTTRSSPKHAIRLWAWVVFAVVDGIRAIPLLLLILLSYYGLPVFCSSLRIPLEPSALQSTAFALTINLSAFVADLVRGAAEGSSKGSVLAGLSLGMTESQVWWRIVLPDVLREIIPSLTLLYITILKMSTLASAVAVYELLHSANTVIQKTYRPLEVYAVVCMAFVVIIVPLSRLARRLERSRLLARRTK